MSILDMYRSRLQRPAMNRLAGLISPSMAARFSRFQRSGASIAIAKERQFRKIYEKHVAKRLVPDEARTQN